MDIDTDGEYLSDSDSNEARQIPRKKHHRYVTFVRVIAELSMDRVAFNLDLNVVLGFSGAKEWSKNCLSPL